MFINYPHKKSSVPLRVVVPNMFTTAAMCCGLASINYSLKEDWDRAVFAVILSAVFDAMDGRAARLLKVTSSFGEVLDSLADFLSFGVAPALLLYQWMLKDQEVFGLLAVTLFVLCSAMRLARFTAAARPGPALPDGEMQRQVVIKAKYFQGLATPAAAAAAMVPVMLAYSQVVGVHVREWLGMAVGIGVHGGMLDAKAAPSSVWVAAAVIGYTVVVSLWMVSRVPMYSFKKMRVDRRKVVPILVAAGLLVILGARDFWLLMAVLTLAYLGTVVLSWPSQRKLMRRPVGEGKIANGQIANSK